MSRGLSGSPTPHRAGKVRARAAPMLRAAGEACNLQLAAHCLPALFELAALIRRLEEDASQLHRCGSVVLVRSRALEATSTSQLVAALHTIHKTRSSRSSRAVSTAWPRTALCSSVHVRLATQQLGNSVGRALKVLDQRGSSGCAAPYSCETARAEAPCQRPTEPVAFQAGIARDRWRSSRYTWALTKIIEYDI